MVSHFDVIDANKLCLWDTPDYPDDCVGDRCFDKSTPSPKTLGFLPNRPQLSFVIQNVLGSRSMTRSQTGGRRCCGLCSGVFGRETGLQKHSQSSGQLIEI